MTSPPGISPTAERTSFVRPIPRRPRRFRSNAEAEPHLSRRFAVRPSRFVVGIDDFGTDRRPENPPRAATHDGVVGLEHYLGRVLSVEEGGEVLVRVWQRPSGREGTAALSWDADFPQEKPAAGAIVYIWAWLELPGEDRIEKHRHVEVEHKVLGPEEKQDILHLLAHISAGEGADEREPGD